MFRLKCIKFDSRRLSVRSFVRPSLRWSLTVTKQVTWSVGARKAKSRKRRLSRALRFVSIHRLWSISASCNWTRHLYCITPPICPDFTAIRTRR